MTVSVQFVSLPSRPFATTDVDLIDGTEEDPWWFLDPSCWVAWPLDASSRGYLKIRYRCTEEQAKTVDAVAIKQRAELVAHRSWVVPVVERAVRVRAALAEDTTDLDALEAYLRGREGGEDIEVKRLMVLGAEYLGKARS